MNDLKQKERQLRHDENDRKIFEKKKRTFLKLIAKREEIRKNGGNLRMARNNISICSWRFSKDYGLDIFKETNTPRLR